MRLKVFLIISISVVMIFGVIGIFTPSLYNRSVKAKVIEGDNTVVEFIADQCYLEVPNNIVSKHLKKRPSDSVSNSSNSKKVVNLPFIIKCKEDNFAIQTKNTLEKYIEFNVCLKDNKDEQECTMFEAEYIKVRKHINILCKNSIKGTIALTVKSNPDIYEFSCDTNQTITQKEYKNRLITSPPS